MNISKLSIHSKPKSQISTKSHRPKKRQSGTGKQLVTPSIENVENSKPEEVEEVCEVINYKEELTYLFFNSAVEHIIKSRETVLQDINVVVESHPASTTDILIKDQDIDPLPNLEVKIKQKSSGKDCGTVFYCKGVHIQIWKTVTKNDIRQVCFFDEQGGELKIRKTGYIKVAQFICLIRQREKCIAGTGNGGLLCQYQQHVKIGKHMSKVSSGPKKNTSITSMSENEVKTKSFVRIQNGHSIASLQDWNNSKPKKKKNIDWIIKPENKVEKIIFNNGNVYEGETSKWLMHGNGTYVWSDGTSYQGEFKDGHPSGKGKLILCDLSTYEGDFNRGCFSGIGVFCIASTPSIYKGSWRNGRKHGHGWFLYEQDNWYEGEWLEDRRHGNGFRQYKTGARYKGMWGENEKHGEGSMVWENSDFYVGEWKDGKPHGYGEYTWNAIFTKHFIFPYCSWYKGNWINGIRNGAGVMNFGTESGAKLAGIWRDNQKHGPGIIICGNGLTLQCNPLFLKDKPVHLNSVQSSVELEDTENETEPVEEIFEEILDEKTAYRKIINEIYAKISIENFSLDILQMITQNSTKISEKQFIKLDNPTANKSELFCPLDIPIHTDAQDVELEYFIDVIWNYYSPDIEDAANQKNKLLSASNGDLINTTNEKEYKMKSQFSKTDEEKLLRNLITLYLPKLTDIYNQYATFMCEEKPIKRKVILIRLFLWQLLRDVELPRKGVSLTDVDTFIAKNPKCGLESDHGPFEPIYFWQFIQALIGCSWLLHLHLTKKGHSVIVYASGTISEIFRQFMEGHIFQNAGKFVGSCLTEYKDLFPIRCMYELYLKMGEPLSVYDFLYFTCVKDFEQPPCFSAIDYDEDISLEVTDGSNITIGDKIMYLHVDEDITWRLNRHLTKKKPTDIFYKTLYTFRSLGRWKIIRFIKKICPLIMTRGKLHLDYKLTFLEFYETVLLCAYEKAEENLKNEKAASKQELDSVGKGLYTTSTITKLGSKKKKQNK